MAEAKGKSSSGGASAKHSRDSKLWSLICLAKEVGGDSEGIQNYAALVEKQKSLDVNLIALTEENKRLTEELQKATQALHEQKASAAQQMIALTTSFGEQYSTFKMANESVGTCRKEIDQLQKEVKSHQVSASAQRKNLTAMNEELQVSRAAQMQLEKSNMSIKRECAVHQSQLHTVNAEMEVLKHELRQAHADIGLGWFHALDDGKIADLQKELKGLSRQCWAIASDFLSDPELAKNPGAAVQIKKLQSEYPDLPLSTEATKEAVFMRRAAGQAVLCDALTRHVFLPFYVSDDKKQAAEQILDAFQHNEAQQSIYRYQVLKAFGNADAELASDIVEDATHAVHDLLDRLVLSSKVDSFHARAEAFFGEALKIWSFHVHHAREIVQAHTPTARDPGVTNYTDFGARDPAKGASELRTLAVPLFPRIMNRDKIIHSGIALWSDQLAALSASQQLSASIMSGRSNSARRNRRRGSAVGT